MKKRLLTGAIIVLVTALFVVTRLYTPYAFDLFVGLLAVMGCVEVSRVLERKRMFTNIIFVGSFPAVFYIAMQIGLLNNRPWYFYIFYFIAIILILFVVNYLFTFAFKKNTNKEREKYGIVVSNNKFALQKCMNSTFVMIYPALLFSCLFIINHFFDFAFVGSSIENSSLIVVFFLILIFAITMVTDSMALVVGMTVKGPKLCPLISPNKTISGAVGGLVFGAGAGVLTYYLFTLNTMFNASMATLGITWWAILIVSVITSIIGQIGDLVASALKRSARVKDYGTIFPGHGGVMDRVDGLIFNALSILIAMFILI